MGGKKANKKRFPRLNLPLHSQVIYVHEFNTRAETRTLMLEIPSGGKGGCLLTWPACVALLVRFDVPPIKMHGNGGALLFIYFVVAWRGLAWGGC